MFKIINQMKTQIEIHPAQAQILVSLLFKKSAKFTRLNQTSLTNDHFSFHINKLLSDKLIRKNISGEYELTKQGKEFANRFDTDNKLIERQAKVDVLVLCVKKEGEKTKYLVQQRLKQPYFGFYGGITGKIRWGETIFEAAVRELNEEAGLAGKLSLAGIKHKMDYAKNGQLLEDKFFFVIRVDKPAGQLKIRYPGGKNIWLTQEEIFALPNLFEGFAESLKIVNQEALYFSETKYKVRGY